MNSPRSFPDLKRTGALLLPLAAITLLNFLANYLYMEDFGIYEDDFMFVLPQMTWTWPDLWAAMQKGMFTWPQGRPVWWTINPVVAFVFAHLPSLTGFYLWGLFLTSTAAFLIFLFLRRYVSASPAFLAAVFFVLFPVDTSKQLLMHQMLLPFGTILAITALWLYATGRTVWAFVTAVIIVLNYEPYLLLFVLAPFLRPTADLWRKIRLLFVHGLACGVLLFGVLLLRSAIGDNRASEVMGSFADVLYRAITAMFIGPVVVARELWQRPLDALLLSDAGQYAWSAVSALLIIGLCWWVARSRFPDTPMAPPSAGGHLIPLWQLAIAGVAFWMLPYMYRFYEWYYPPIVTVGRLSHMHQPSVFGLCLLVAVTAETMAGLLRNMKVLRVFALAIITFYLALLVPFNQQVQLAEYVTNWAQQSTFIREVVAQISDAREGDIVLVRLESRARNPVPQTPGYSSSNWISAFSVGGAFKDFIDSPSSWSCEPSLDPIFPWTDAEVEEGGVRLKTVEWSPADWPLVENGKFLLIDWRNGRWTRIADDLVLAGEKLASREANVGAARNIKLSDLADRILRDSPETEPWPSFATDYWYPASFEQIAARKAAQEAREERRAERELRRREREERKLQSHPETQEMPSR